MSKRLSSPAKNKYQAFLKEKEPMKIKKASKFGKEKANSKLLKRFKLTYSMVVNIKKFQRENEEFQISMKEKCRKIISIF